MPASSAPDVLTGIRSLLTDVSTLATVLGFGAVGVFVAAKFVATRLLATIYELVERRQLGSQYDTMRKLAIEDGAFDPKKNIRLYPILMESVTDANRALIVSNTERLAARLNRLASGSTKLRNKDLLSSETLLLPFCFSRDIDGCSLDLEEFSATVLRPAPEGPGSPGNRRHLLLASAGFGKSLTCLAMEKDAREDDVLGDRLIFMVTAEDFADHEQHSSGSATLGDEWWSVNLFASRLGWRSPSELQRRALRREIQDNAVILIDGLDEIAARLDSSSFELFLQSWLFLQARLVTSRASFYRAALEGHPAVRSHERYWLNTPTALAREGFMEGVCLALHGESGGTKFRMLKKLLQDHESLAELTETPLLLMMLLEIDHVERWTGVQIDTVGVYEEFVRQVLDRETLRLQKVISRDTLLAIYQEMAWLLISADSRDETHSGVTRAQLLEINRRLARRGNGANEQSVLDAIMASPLVLIVASPGLRGVGLQVSFTHYSFPEFLVAQWAFGWMSGDSERGDDFFSQLETPGVSAFLKEYLARSLTHPVTARAIGNRLARKLDALIAAERTAADEGLGRRRTFAAGQVAYYLGMIDDPRTRPALAAMASSDADFWIRRAAAIGLAFGGQSNSLNGLVDEMHHQISKGDFTHARKSIAIDLSFYGDQPFSILDPTGDAGGPTCRRLVTRQCHELCADAEVANRRNCLFNIIYLFRHRPQSKESFVETFRETGPMLWKALDDIENAGAHIPELAEVREIMRELAVHDPRVLTK